MTLVEHVKTLANFLPGGRLFNAKNNSASNLYKFLTGIAEEYLNADTIIEDFLFNIFPNQTEQLIYEWEQAVGIPDDCFPGDGTLIERRRHVLAKLASLGVTTAADFVDLADIMGVTVIVTNGVDEILPSVFPMTFPLSLDAAPVTPSTFTMVFPFVLDSGIVDVSRKFEIVVYHVGPQPIIECLFTKLKPANCTITFIETPIGEQGCGDPLMQCGEPFAQCGE